jgi:hypothetical protein
MKISPRAILIILLASNFAFIAPASEPRGPWYDFPEHSSPGAGMWLREVSREKRGGVTHVFYSISTAGLAPGQDVNLYQWDWVMSDGILALAGFRVEADGKVICSNLEDGVPEEEARHWCKGALDKTKIDAIGFQPGQALRAGLISTDRQQKAFAEVVPFPIESEDHGCRLVAERLSEDAGTWTIKGDGFRSGETVHYVWRGPGNSLKGDFKPTDKGTLAIMVRPSSSGTIEGTVTFKVHASACNPILRFRWAVMARR